MWAMIPMLRTRSSATLVSVTATSLLSLPAVVRERLVGLRHPVHVVLALERVPLRLERVENLGRELVAHVLLAAVAGEGDKPAQRERAAAPLRHLHRDLVVRAADTAAAHLEHCGDGLHSLLEHLDGRPPRALADLLERAVDDLLRDGLLPVQPPAVREPHARDLPQRRVRLTRRDRRDTRADAAALGRGFEGRRLCTRLLRDAALADKLIDGRHRFSLCALRAR